MLTKEDLLKPKFFEVPWLKKNGFKRRVCAKCGAGFWSKHDSPTCGEPPCEIYHIIGNPIIPKKYDWKTMRTEFINWFEKEGHTPVQRYSTICRWKPDTLFVGASIYGFLPWVVNKTIEPPANPLVIDQPSVRFGDLDNVGLGSGRHGTQFSMFGHHAFNYPDKKIYWKDKTVQLCYDWLKYIGIKDEVITFKESLWKGGGYAGPCFEILTGGNEVATLVFMEYGGPVDGKYSKLDVQVVDTGYGMERHVWASQGTPTIYESIYPGVINWIKEKAGIKNYDKEIMESFCKVCGQLDVDEVNVDVARQKIVEEISKKLKYGTKDIMDTIKPYHYIYQIADHARAIAFILGDGVVPSNSQEGYLARLLIRRSIRNMNDLNIGHVPFEEIVMKQIEDLQEVYPELKDTQDDIVKMLQVEQEKYKTTLKKGKSLVTRLVADLKKKKKEIDKETLMMLYDSHGLLPRDVKKYADDKVKIADVSDIDTKLAVQKEAVIPEEVRPFDITGILPTDLLYMGDENLFNFNAKVLKVLEDERGRFVILDQTAFYPRGGGQEPDHGYLNKHKVYDVEKFGNVVVHYTEDPKFEEGDTIECSVDKKRRRRIVAHHTTTHIIAGATKKLLGPHIWQRGSKKDEDKAHIDLTHYNPLTDDEVRKIENMSNVIVNKKIDVIKRIMDRTSAEREYGFTIYQGGAVPGKMLRICSIEGHDTEACGGIHTDNTEDVGLISIIKTERPTDGTVRLIYKAGDVAKEFLEEREELLEDSAKLLGVSEKDLPKAVENLLNLWKEKRKLVDKTYEEVAERRMGELKFEDINELKVLIEYIPGADVNQLREISRKMTGDNTVIILVGGDEKLFVFGSAGKKAVERGIDVGKIISDVCGNLDGNGGGTPGLAQGFGTKKDGIEEVLSKVKGAM